MGSPLSHSRPKNSWHPRYWTWVGEKRSKKRHLHKGHHSIETIDCINYQGYGRISFRQECPKQEVHASPHPLILTPQPSLVATSSIGNQGRWDDRFRRRVTQKVSRWAYKFYPMLNVELPYIIYCKVLTLITDQLFSSMFPACATWHQRSSYPFNSACLLIWNPQNLNTHYPY